MARKKMHKPSEPNKPKAPQPPSRTVKAKKRIGLYEGMSLGEILTETANSDSDNTFLEEVHDYCLCCGGCSCKIGYQLVCVYEVNDPTYEEKFEKYEIELEKFNKTKMAAYNKKFAEYEKKVVEYEAWKEQDGREKRRSQYERMQSLMID